MNAAARVTSARKTGVFLINIPRPRITLADFSYVVGTSMLDDMIFEVRMTLRQTLSVDPGTLRASAFSSKR